MVADAEARCAAAQQETSDALDKLTFETYTNKTLRGMLDDSKRDLEDARAKLTVDQGTTDKVVLLTQERDSAVTAAALAHSQARELLASHEELCSKVRDLLIAMSTTNARCSSKSWPLNSNRRATHFGTTLRLRLSHRRRRQARIYPLRNLHRVAFISVCPPQNASSLRQGKESNILHHPHLSPNHNPKSTSHFFHPRTKPKLR